MTTIIVPGGSEPIVNKNRAMTTPFRDVIISASNLPVLTGSGSPEGVLDAVLTRMYMDEDGSAGNILYIKQKTKIGTDTTKGWILV